MSSLPPFVLDEIRRRRESRGPIWNGGIAVFTFVTAGAGVATWALPPGDTPTNVARAYVEARYDRDWARAWELVCRSTRSAFGDYAAYVEDSEYAFDSYVGPTDVDVSVDDVQAAVTQGRPSAAVTLTVTSVENWETGGEVLVVDEDGEFRVCGDQPSGA